MYSFKDELEEIFFGAKNPKTIAKKKLNEYYDRYGERPLDIENALSDAEYRDYFMVSGYADEVLRERREAREARRNQSLLLDDAAQQKDEEKISEEKSESDLAKRSKSVDEESAQNMKEETKNIEEKMELLLQKAKTHLRSKDAEDTVEHIYLDIFGNITVGAGKVINDEKTFMAVNFEVNGRPATVAEKREAYQTFQKLRRNNMFGRTKKANDYEKYSPLRVTPQTIENLLDRHVRNDIRQLRKGMPEFEHLPMALQEVLVDIRYNSGAITEKSWPKLREAIREKNLSKIIERLNRPDIPEKRNKWAREKIRSIKDWGVLKD